MKHNFCNFRNVILGLFLFSFAESELAAISWGFEVAQREINPQILHYITKRQVPEDLAGKLNTLFKDGKVVKAFDTVFGLRWGLEEDTVRIAKQYLATHGFTFLGNENTFWVFKHISIPGKVIKLAGFAGMRDYPKYAVVNFTKLVSRIWLADYVRNLIPKLNLKTHFLVPKKEIHFTDEKLEVPYLAMMVVADELPFKTIDSKDARKLTPQEKRDLDLLTKKTGLDMNEGNVMTAQPGTLALPDIELAALVEKSLGAKTDAILLQKFCEIQEEYLQPRPIEELSDRLKKLRDKLLILVKTL